MSDSGASSDHQTRRQPSPLPHRTCLGRNVLKPPRPGTPVTRPRPPQLVQAPWSGHRRQGRVPRPLTCRRRLRGLREGRGPSAALRIHRRVAGQWMNPQLPAPRAPHEKGSPRGGVGWGSLSTSGDCRVRDGGTDPAQGRRCGPWLAAEPRMSRRPHPGSKQLPSRRPRDGAHTAASRRRRRKRRRTGSPHP